MQLVNICQAAPPSYTYWIQEVEMQILQRAKGHTQLNEHAYINMYTSHRKQNIIFKPIIWIEITHKLASNLLCIILERYDLDMVISRFKSMTPVKCNQISKNKRSIMLTRSHFLQFTKGYSCDIELKGQVPITSQHPDTKLSNWQLHPCSFPSHIPIHKNRRPLLI